MNKAEILGLLPCPFCGGEAAVGTTRYSRPLPNAQWADGSPIVEAFSINCISCSATNRGSVAGGHQTEEMAAKKWNTRAIASTMEDDRG